MPSQVPPASRSRPARTFGWSSQKATCAAGRPKYSSRLAATIKRLRGCVRQANAMRHMAYERQETSMAQVFCYQPLEAAEDFLLSRRARDEQRGEAVALDQSGDLRFETRGVGDVFVDLHPGGLIVAAPQEASAYARGFGEFSLQGANSRARAHGVFRRHAVVDVIARLQGMA